MNMRQRKVPSRFGSKSQPWVNLEKIAAFFSHQFQGLMGQTHALGIYHKFYHFRKFHSTTVKLSTTHTTSAPFYRDLCSLGRSSDKLSNAFQNLIECGDEHFSFKNYVDIGGLDVENNWFINEKDESEANITWKILNGHFFEKVEYTILSQWIPCLPCWMKTQCELKSQCWYCFGCMQHPYWDRWWNI